MMETFLEASIRRAESKAATLHGLGTSFKSFPGNKQNKAIHSQNKQVQPKNANKRKFESQTANLSPSSSATAFKKSRQSDQSAKADKAVASIMTFIDKKHENFNRIHEYLQEQLPNKALILENIKGQIQATKAKNRLKR
jgi:hypothetical protein